MDGEERKRQAWMEKPALQLHEQHQYVCGGRCEGAHRRPPLEKWPLLLVCVPSARRLLSCRRVLLNQIFNSKNTIYLIYIHSTPGYFPYLFSLSLQCFVDTPLLSFSTPVENQRLASSPPPRAFQHFATLHSA